MADFLHAGIYYHLYGAGANDTDVLLKASKEVQEFTDSETFTATMVLVVTWNRVRQAKYRFANVNSNQVSDTLSCMCKVRDTSSCRCKVMDTFSCRCKVMDTFSCRCKVRDTLGCMCRVNDALSCRCKVRDTFSCRCKVRDTLGCMCRVKDALSCRCKWVALSVVGAR